MLRSACLLLGLFAGLGKAAMLNDDSPPKCLVTVAGVPLEKSIGDTWNLPDEPCLTHTCAMMVAEGANGTATAVNRAVRQTCFMRCNNEFELITRPGQCCGECVQTKCRSGNGTIHAVGSLWRDPADSCRLHECIRTPHTDGGVSISTFGKECPPLPRRCPPNRIVQHECCPVCATAAEAAEAVAAARRSARTINAPAALNHTFVYDTELHDSIMDPATYLNHPCARECTAGGEPLVCNYTFIVEWYETLSKACFDCPRTPADCERPQCIPADGMARSIVTVNRMMPGPRLQVCFGDTLRVDIVNRLMGESTTLHWHGMHQRETPFMDGVPMVTQCPIAPHTTFRYTFRADHEGTHWWHSHTGVQRSDGALGALIVRRPRSEEPAAVRRLYDFDEPEHTMFVQDWDHVTAVASFNSFHHSLGNNKPKNVLINARGRYGEQTLLAAAAPAAPAPAADDAVELLSSTEHMPNEVDWLQATNAASGKVELEPTTTAEAVVSAETAAQMEEDELALRETTLQFARIASTTPANAPKNNVRNKRQTIISQQPLSVAANMPPLEIFHVAPGGRYRFRHINAGFLNCPVEISIDGHNLTVIASDGWYFEPVEVATLVSYAGERFDFVVRADQPVGNYWLRVRGLMDCDERFTKAHQVAVLRYAGAPTDQWPSEEWPTYEFERHGLQMNALNRGTGLNTSVSVAELTSLQETDARLLKPQADFKFYVYYDFYGKNNPHFNHPKFYSNADMATADTQFIGPQLNRITMKMPSSPLLVARDQIDASTFCNESSLAVRNINCSAEFCECSHVLQIPLNSTVELVLVDEGYMYNANHPFHLHGQGFQVVAMERLQPSGITIEEIQQLDNAGQIARRLRGSPTKDTITVPDGGYTIVRFVADNPGYWLFHCHIEFHAEVGMALVFKVGEHAQMRPVPRNFPQCSSYMPHMGEGDVDDDSGAAAIGWSQLGLMSACAAVMRMWV